MANQTKIILAGLVAALCVALVWSINRPDTIVYQPGEAGAPLGALAGPDIPSPYLRWGDVATFQARAELTQASTTICALQAPAATSTLVHATLLETVSSTTASIIKVAKSSTAFATTTHLTGEVLAANAQTSLDLATTTDNDYVFGPSQWLVISQQGGVGGTSTFSPTGTCQAAWLVL